MLSLWNILKAGKGAPADEQRAMLWKKESKEVYPFAVGGTYRATRDITVRRGPNDTSAQVSTVWGGSWVKLTEVLKVNLRGTDVIYGRSYGSYSNGYFCLLWGANTYFFDPNGR